MLFCISLVGCCGDDFFKFVSFASFIELTVHRTIWTAVLLILTTSFYKKWPEFNKIFKKEKKSIITFFIRFIGKYKLVYLALCRQCK